MPSVFSVGAAHERVALPLAICVTAIWKAGKETLVVPSLTPMVMFEYVLTSAAVDATRQGRRDEQPKNNLARHLM